MHATACIDFLWIIIIYKWMKLHLLWVLTLESDNIPGNRAAYNFELFA